MKKMLVAAGVIALCMVLPVLAADDGERGYHRGDGHHSLERMSRHLELDDGQREQIQAIMQTRGPELRELRDRIRDARRSLRSHASNGFDESGARAAADELGSLTAAAAFAGARMRADIRQVLTEEQRARMDERHKKRSHHDHKDKGPRKQRRQ